MVHYLTEEGKQYNIYRREGGWLGCTSREGEENWSVGQR